MRQIDSHTYSVHQGEIITLEITTIGFPQTQIGVSLERGQSRELEPDYYSPSYRFQVNGSWGDVVHLGLSLFFPYEAPESARYELTLTGSSAGDISHLSIWKNNETINTVLRFVVSDHPGIRPPKPWPHA